MVELEMTRSRLHAPDGTEQQAQSGAETNAPMTIGRTTPRPAFRLLTLTLLIFALADRLPAAGLWRIVVGSATALVLAGMLAAWIGLARVSGRAAMGSRPDRPTATPFKLVPACRVASRIGRLSLRGRETKRGLWRKEVKP
jgi:hypothetical protein